MCFPSEVCTLHGVSQSGSGLLPENIWAPAGSLLTVMMKARIARRLRTIRAFHCSLARAPARLLREHLPHQSHRIARGLDPSLQLRIFNHVQNL